MDHDPNYERSTDPSVFRIVDLRRKVEKVVLEEREHCDAYTKLPIFDNSRVVLEMDHVLEIQCARDAYDIVKKNRPINLEVKELECKVRETINR